MINKKKIGMKPRMKFMSLCIRINLNGLYWIKSPSRNLYINPSKLSGKKFKFSNLLSPKTVFDIEAGKYDVNM